VTKLKRNKIKEQRDDEESTTTKKASTPAFSSLPCRGNVKMLWSTVGYSSECNGTNSKRFKGNVAYKQ
jgi:hypothetical protein